MTAAVMAFSMKGAGSLMGNRYRTLATHTFCPVSLRFAPSAPKHRCIRAASLGLSERESRLRCAVSYVLCIAEPQ